MKSAVATPSVDAASPGADRTSRSRAPILVPAWLILGLALYGLTTALHEAAQLIAGGVTL